VASIFADVSRSAMLMKTRGKQVMTQEDVLVSLLLDFMRLNA